MQYDQVDRILAQWQKERPDVDTSAMAVSGRISRLSLVLGRAVETTFAAFDLNRGGFDVLATLRRSGPPYRLNPTQLFSTLMLSSGAMTNRLDRLEEAGLIERLPDPDDRRATLIGLTEQGRATVDAALEADLAAERTLLASLSPEEREQLACLLRKLLLAAEADPALRSGLT